MFAVEFTAGEKRGLESKTNKCVLCYRRSENFPIGGNWAVWLDMPADCFPKCPELWESESRLASCHGGASSKEPQCWALGQPSFHSAYPWLPSLTANSAPQLSRAELNFSPLPLLNVLLLIFEISSCVCCLFTMLSSNSVTLVWSYLMLFSGPFLSLFFFPYYSPNFVCLLAIHLFLCWLLFLQWFLSLYGPVFKSML